jgi:uncharacterized phiE125 gp8 family phage protein
MIQITPLALPTGEPVTVDAAKLRLRVDHALEDGLISDLISAARQRIEAELGLVMLTTRFRETRDLWGPLDRRGGLVLSRGPLISVEQVCVADSARSFTTLDPGFYAPFASSWPPTIGATSLAVIQPTARSGGLRIDYTAGFGAAADAVPAPLKEAVLALVAHAYEHRGEGAAPLGLADPWLAAFRRRGL